MKIGVYGGTFNPPHLGHMQAAQAAAEVLGLDRLLLVPAGLPPHKGLPRGTPDAGDRLAMLSLLADGLGSKTEVWDFELRRAGKSYTADTLLQLRGQYPDAEFWLLMGSDMFLTLQTWREPEVIMREAKIAAFARTEADCGDLFAVQGAWLSKKYGASICTVELPMVVDISSTALREELLTGRGREYLYPPVYGYILRRGLYGAPGKLTGLSEEDLRCVSYSMVKAKRIAHIRGTEREAVRLAARWGADGRLAARAAILHDCTKYLTLDEQLSLCRAHNVELDELERNAVKLLHAKTGAALAGQVFGEPEEVCEAIRWHTTGKAGMTVLEKVLYIADYIEPTRNLDGVDALRALAGRDLDRAVAAGLEMTIEDMRGRGVPIHENTLAALADLKGKA